MTIQERLKETLEEAQATIEADLEGRPLSRETIEQILLRVKEARRLLAGQWIGLKEAKELLGISSDNTIRAWADRGILKHANLPNGRIRLDRSDVMEKAALMRGLGDDDEMTQEEMAEAFAGRNKGLAPWGRSKEA